jgi:hypothetical protein
MEVKPKQRWSCNKRGIIIEVLKKSTSLGSAWLVKVIQIMSTPGGYYYQLNKNEDFYDSRFQDGEFLYLEGQDSPV